MRHFKYSLLLLISIIFISYFTALSQITIVKSDMMDVGTDINFFFDTSTTNLDFMGSATNQNWDFTSAVSDTFIQSDILSPVGQAKANLFPTATAALNRFEFNTQYYNNTDSESIFLGTVVTFLDTQVYHQNYSILNFPSTLGSQLSDVGDKNKDFVFQLGFDPDLTGPHPFVDSTTNFSTEFYESDIDAYGTVKTPVATYNALRQHTKILDIDSAYMYANGKWQPMSSLLAGLLGRPLVQMDSTFAYAWIAKDMSLPACNIEYDPANNNKILTVAWTNLVPTGISQNKVKLPIEVYPNPVNDVLNIKNAGNETMTFKIISQDGQEVVHGILEKSLEVNVSHLNPGIYILKIEDKNGRIDTRKIVKT